MKKYKTGLVLSGGGSRGFAHLGVIAALNEKGIQPDIIAGVSAGAIVGAFIASGKSPQEILKLFAEKPFFKYTKINLPIHGLLKLDRLLNIIEKEIPAKRIEDLEIPFYIGISNLNKGRMEYKNTGPLGLTVLASSSIPILFAPIEIDGDFYADGGLMNNIPVKAIRNITKKIIVSNISPLNPKGKTKTKNLVQIASRTFHMTINANLDEAKKAADLFIEPEGIDEYDILNNSHAYELYDIGYNSTIKMLEKTEKTSSKKYPIFLRFK